MLVTLSVMSNIIVSSLRINTGIFLYSISGRVLATLSVIFNIVFDPGDPTDIILATGFVVRGLKPGRGPWIFFREKSSEYGFLRKGSKAVGPVT